MFWDHGSRGEFHIPKFDIRKVNCFNLDPMDSLSYFSVSFAGIWGVNSQIK